jgi:hypothetical protein
MAKQAAAGLQTGTGESPAASWLDAEDATTRQVLTWALQHDATLALRLALALAPWWQLRGRLAGQYSLLRQAAGGAETASHRWCAAQYWLGWTAQFSADPAGALGHFTAVRDAIGDRGPSRALADALAGRAAVLRVMGRIAEAAGHARRSLALAREIGYPAGELVALMGLSFDADYAGDHAGAVRLARQAGQITAGIPGGLARMCSYVLTIVLADAGDLAEAARVGAAGLARARDASDLWNQALLLPRVVDLDLRAGLADVAAGASCRCSRARGETWAARTLAGPSLPPGSGTRRTGSWVAWIRRRGRRRLSGTVRAARAGKLAQAPAPAGTDGAATGVPVAVSRRPRR